MIEQLQAQLDEVSARFYNFQDDVDKLELEVEKAVENEQKARTEFILKPKPQGKANITKAKRGVTTAETALSEHCSNYQALLRTQTSLKDQIRIIKADQKRERYLKIAEAMPELWPDVVATAQKAIARVMQASALKSGSPLSAVDPRLMTAHICLESSHNTTFKEALKQAEIDLEQEIGL